VTSWFHLKWFDLFHGGGTVKRDAYGRINWQCSLGSFQRFVPLQLVPAPPQPIYSTPIGRTMELFA